MVKKGEGLLSFFNEFLLFIDIVVYEFEIKLVDIDVFRVGMVRFRFFFYGSQFGFVLDFKILVFMLDLVSLVDFNY